VFACSVCADNGIPVEPAAAKRVAKRCWNDDAYESNRDLGRRLVMNAVYASINAAYDPDEVTKSYDPICPFCECGVEGAHERLWDPTDVAEPKLKRLIKNAIRTLRRKEVALKPKETAAYILHVWSETDDVDRAMSKGIEMGIVAQAASETNQDQQPDEKRMQG